MILTTADKINRKPVILNKVLKENFPKACDNIGPARSILALIHRPTGFRNFDRLDETSQVLPSGDWLASDNLVTQLQLL